MVLTLHPSRRAHSSWLNIFESPSMARAFSMTVRSSRWKFSSSESAIASSSDMSRTMAGMSGRPAILLAAGRLQREEQLVDVRLSHVFLSYELCARVDPLFRRALPAEDLRERLDAFVPHLERVLDDGALHHALLEVLDLGVAGVEADH